MEQDIKIMAEPSGMPNMCKFTVDRPVLAGDSVHFANREAAEGSPLAEELFDIESVAEVLIAEDTITVTTSGPVDWRVTAKQLGGAIRAHIQSGEPAVSEKVLAERPSESEIKEKVARLLEEEINPAVASHGGVVSLIDVKGSTVFLELGGGCQGCGMANVTLKAGVERAIRAAVPGVGEILDTTDHAAGRNPYYASSGR